MRLAFRSTCWLVAGGSAGLILASTVAVSASSTGELPGFVMTRDCQEEQAFVDGSTAAVATQLPTGYTAAQDPSSGTPILFVRSENCRSITVGGSTAPATMASFGVVVRSPDGTGCASAAPGLGPNLGDVPPACNWYTLGWLSTNSRVVDWFHDRSPGFPVIYAPALHFDLAQMSPSSGGAPFQFDAPASTGAPFSMSAITRQRPGTLSVRGGYWTRTRFGAAKLVFASDSLSSGDATGTVSAPGGTRIARLLGATSRPYLPGYSGIAAEHWDQGVYRQQLLWPVANEHQFAGSCSASGTVRFTPPASNTATALRYDYTARGTCNGTLDGRQLSAAPITMHQAGYSYGSCSTAQTTRPGDGTIVFSPRTAITYTLDFTSTVTEVNFSLYGDRSGMAQANGSFLTTRTPPTVASDCAGSGARDVPLDINLKTETPLASQPLTTEQPTAHAKGAAPHPERGSARVRAARYSPDLPRTGKGASTADLAIAAISICSSIALRRISRTSAPNDNDSLR